MLSPPTTLRGSHSLATSGPTKPPREPCQPRDPGEVWDGVDLDESGRGVGGGWHRPSRGKRGKWKWLKEKCKHREIQRLWKTAHSTLGEARDTGEESHTIPTRHPTLLELSVGK